MERHFTLKSMPSQLSLDFSKLEICLQLELFASDMHKRTDLIDARLNLFDIANALVRFEFLRFKDRGDRICWLHFCSRLVGHQVINFLAPCPRRLW